MVDRLCTSLAGLSLSAIRRYTALAAEREDCITLTIGEPDLPTPAPICEAAVRALAGGSTHYTTNQGSASLRAKLAAYEAKTRQLDYGPDEILVTAGATEAIYCALTGVLDPGDEVVIPTPAFGLYETVTRLAGAVPVYLDTAWTGFQLTYEAVCAAGADACLVVTPYYNKATQRGLIAHYTAIADASDRPVILYNVPSRTGCNLLPETCAALAAHPRIAAVKEASGNLSQIVSLFHRATACLDVYSGNDDQIVPILAMGGEGCISVLSNVLPREAVQLCELFFSGDVRGAAALQCRLLPVIDALFSEVNPIPVKAALAKMGYGTDTLRLPLTPMEEGSRAVLLNALEAWGV